MTVIQAEKPDSKLDEANLLEKNGAGLPPPHPTLAATKHDSQETIPEDEYSRNWWIIVVGFFVLMTESGSRQILNIFTKSIQEEYQCSPTVADLAFVVIPNAASLMSGPLVAIFYQMFGARAGIMLGSGISAAGFIAGSISNSVYRLYFYALTIGIGCGLMRNAIISVQCEYFAHPKRRNFVLSLICIGPGIGIFVFPRMFMPMIDAWGWKNAVRALAGMYAACLVMGAFVARKPTIKKKTLKDLMGLRVWFSWSFIFHQLACFCASAVCIVYVSHTLVWMRQQGIEGPEHVYSYNGIASIVGRICLTLALEFTNWNIGYLMVSSYVVGQVAIGFGGLCRTKWQFIAQNAFAGYGFGLYQTTLSPYLVRMVGSDFLCNSLGYTNMINGIAAFASINASGLLVHIFDSQTAEFVYIAIVAAGACIFSTISFVLLLRAQKAECPIVLPPRIEDVEAAEPLKAGSKAPSLLALPETMRERQDSSTIQMRGSRAPSLNVPLDFLNKRHSRDHPVLTTAQQ